MFSINKQLANGVSAQEFLTLVKNNQDNSFILTLKTLIKASPLTYSTISFCRREELIIMHPTSNNAYAFKITAKGAEFLETDTVCLNA